MKKVIFTSVRNLFFILILLFTTVSSYANHILGMDLNYAWVSGNTYKITAVVYGNCGSAALSTGFNNLPRGKPQICIYNGNTYVTTIALIIDSALSFANVTPVCPADTGLTQCTNLASTIPGVKRFTYSLNYTFPSASSVWRIIFDGDLGPDGQAGRSQNISNINTPQSTYIHLIDTLNNTVGDLHNSSPVLSVLPTPFFCVDQNDNYNPGAIDPDADSLSFFLVPGLNGAQNCTSTIGTVSYIAPWTATAPMTTSSFSFNQATGQISFNPSTVQTSLVVYNIEEYRDDILVGTSQREMTFFILTCTNPSPSGSIASTAPTNGTVDDSSHFHICQNSGPFSLFINPTEAGTTNDITVTATGLPAGLSFTTVNNGTPNPNVTISWTSTGVTPGSYTIFITYTDNNCPLVGIQTYGLTMTIYPASGIGYTVLSAATCTQKEAILVTPTGTSPWSINETTGGTTTTLPSVTGPFTDSLGSGTYTFSLLNASPFCTDSFTISIPQALILNPTATAANPTACGSNDGTITIQNLNAGSTDTIQYFDNGVLQTQSQLVAADGTITFTGMAPGTYTNFSYLTANPACVPVIPGPLNIVALPPPPIPVINSNSPICVGQTLYLSGSDAVSGGTYAWTFANGGTSSAQYDTIPNTTIADSGVYMLTYIVGNCQSTDSENVPLYPPIVLSNVTPNTIIPYGSSIHLNVDGALYYRWRPEDGSLSNPNINDPIATPKTTTVYEVTGTSLYGCMDSTTITISVDPTETIFIPTAFTPNNDGLNDIFRIGHVTYEQLNDFSVYNRWGQLVYHNTFDITKGWDGTFNGVPQDIGVYNYVIVITFPDGETKAYKGDVTLIR